MKWWNKKVLLIFILAMLLFAWWWNGRNRAGIWHPSQFDQDSGLGVRAMAAHQYDDAEYYFNRAIASAQALGSDDPRIGTAYHDMGDLRVVQKRYSDAEDCYQKALNLLDRNETIDQREREMIMSNLAAVYVMTNRAPEACQLMERAVALNDRVRIPGDPETSRALRFYGATLLANGRVMDAANAATRASALAAAASRPSDR